MLIGEFSKITGLSVDTLRYYDSINLLVPKRENQVRQYTKQDLERAKLISFLKETNFSLVEIKTLVSLDQKIDSYIESNQTCYKEVEECYGVVIEKYQALIKQEQEIKQAKERILQTLGKMKQFIEVGEFHEE
ncbi:MerR family transcriptional regulator [Haloplasma contractile]|uniref:PTS system fructose-specific IIA component protein n=1 Tax=Haloplasma contractile SSD-17B TaxID=1033810 RepID=F7PW65_9MOLU|nr:MerR family transcriptional regulator [Haloplasma contractile]ERJ11275.1 PTS system fructose-specific IIA component protein [Haloplasma contractile SSD-17B]